MVGEEHEPLVPVDVERRQQPVPRLLPHLLLEHAAEVGHLDTGDRRSHEVSVRSLEVRVRSVRSHLGWHGVVDVDGVVDLVLGAAAFLYRTEVLLVALETGKLPSHHQIHKGPRNLMN